MKDEIKDILLAAGAAELLLLLAFFFVGVANSAWLLPAAVVYGVSSLCIFLIGSCLAGRRVNRTMQRVNDTIQSLLFEVPEEPFAMSEDTLLGKFQFQIFKVHDILRSYEERERRLRTELGTLIGDLVHQMNTPIANICMYGDFLLQEDLEKEEERQFLKRIRKQSEKLGWLGEGFSKASRLETGIMAMKQKEQPVQPMLLRAIDQIALKAEQKGMEVRLSCPASLSGYFDAKWTEEAVFNLLDNGVKYAPEGTVLQVTAEAYDLYLRIGVTSQGPPIPREQYNRLFQRFYRGAEVQQQPGVGLGLYLVRKIAAEQGGYVKVSGKSGEGNTFSLYLLRKERKQ